MKKVVAMMLSLVLALGLMAGCGQKDAGTSGGTKTIESLKIAFSPYADADQITTATEPLEALLKAKLQEKGYDVQNIDMTVGTSYTAVGEALSAGSADIGFISGGNYVLFSDDCDVLKCIAPTFDDGPAANNDSLVNTLTKANAKATFFDVGAQVSANPSATGRKAAAGMEIGIHGWNHIDYTAMGYGYSYYDFDAAATAVRDATGTWPTLFRPPYGYYSTDVINAAGDLGMATILWTDNTWDYEYTDANSLRWDTVDMASRNAVLLMHDDVAATNNALPGIVSDLQAEGYTLVTITQMLGRLDTHVLHFDP